MKFLWFFLHIVALSALIANPIQASSDNKSSIDFQAMQRSIVQIAQQVAVDMGKPLLNKPSDQAKPSEQEKSLPAIVPQANNQSTSYHQRSNSYATNPDSDPPRYVRRLSDIGVERFKDITWLEVGLEHYAL